MDYRRGDNNHKIDWFDEDSVGDFLDEENIDEKIDVSELKGPDRATLAKMIPVVQPIRSSRRGYYEYVRNVSRRQNKATERYQRKELEREEKQRRKDERKREKQERKIQRELETVRDNALDIGIVIDESPDDLNLLSNLHTNDKQNREKIFKIAIWVVVGIIGLSLALLTYTLLSINSKNQSIHGETNNDVPAAIAYSSDENDAVLSNESINDEMQRIQSAREQADAREKAELEEKANEQLEEARKQEEERKAKEAAEKEAAREAEREKQSAQETNNSEASQNTSAQNQNQQEEKPSIYGETLYGSLMSNDTVTLTMDGYTNQKDGSNVSYTFIDESGYVLVVASGNVSNGHFSISVNVPLDVFAKMSAFHTENGVEYNESTQSILSLKNQLIG